MLMFMTLVSARLLADEKKRQSQKMNMYRIKGQRLRDTERDISTYFNTS